MAQAIFQRFWDVDVKSGVSSPSYPAISSIPHTSDDRLAQASPSICPDEPIPAASAQGVASDSSSSTVLYLAYGSNLCAETFLGQRGIRPISQVNVSAPSLRLTFDLPGIPYKEPCFANTAPRKIPKPPKLPPKLPDPPSKLPEPPSELPSPPDMRPLPHNIPSLPGQGGSPHASQHGDPVWDKGLIGVVYEVTAADYATIVKTEGGGASYQDILVPCFPLLPNVGVPEKPPIPELPKPFLAHTLYAPLVPGGGKQPEDDESAALRKGKLINGGRDPEEPDDPRKKWQDWWKKLLLQPVRPDPEYAQPSARYLKLITDGAREHDLPQDYQRWLQSLQPYTITSRRQQIGQLLFLVLVLPLVGIILGLSRILADKDGRIPVWLGVAMGGLIHLSWMAYDGGFKPIFGDGERTQPVNEDGSALTSARLRWRRSGFDEEKACLLGQE